MKKGYAVSVGVLALALMFLGAISADAQWRSKTHDVYEALTGVSIKVDGDMADWDDILETVTGTDGKPFTGVELEIGDPFQEHNGGKWAGADDHETSVMMVWEPAAFYIGLIVTDDTHENAANSGWNGDAFQLAFEMSGKRKPGNPILLYNFALGGNGDLVIHNEKAGGEGLVEDDVEVVRDEAAKTTYYELKFTPKELGLKGFAPDTEFGVGICVNDGDKGAGQDGQKGWSGWYTHSIVFGKNPENTGLVRLSAEQLAVHPKDKLTTTWGTLKSAR